MRVDKNPILGEADFEIAVIIEDRYGVNRRKATLHPDFNICGGCILSIRAADTLAAYVEIGGNKHLTGKRAKPGDYVDVQFVHRTGVKHSVKMTVSKVIRTVDGGDAGKTTGSGSSVSNAVKTSPARSGNCKTLVRFPASETHARDDMSPFSRRLAKPQVQ